MRTLHALIGLQTELGELTDLFKKHIFYNQTLSFLDVKEEMGDIQYYLGILFDEYKFDLKDIWESNVAKLKARYPNGFDTEKALKRDLPAEKEALIKKPVEEIEEQHKQRMKCEVQTCTNFIMGASFPLEYKAEVVYLCQEHFDNLGLEIDTEIADNYTDEELADLLGK